MNLKQLALDCLILASQNTYDKAEEREEGSGGYAVYMQEDYDDDYDDVRMIGIDKSKYSEYRNKEIIKSFMKYNNITKEDIIEYRKNYIRLF